MKTEVYVAPKVLLHQPIRFETAQSWNRGLGRIPPNNGENPHGYAPPKDIGVKPGRGKKGGK